MQSQLPIAPINVIQCLNNDTIYICELVQPGQTQPVKKMVGITLIF